MEYTYYSYSGIGQRHQNEDYLQPNSENGTSQDFVLCDGMGGHGNGDLASNFVANYVYSQLKQTPSLNTDYAQIIIEQTSAALYEYANAQGNPKMGTTLVFLKFESDKAFAGWVGDSRLYHFRNGEILFRTEDHSMINWLAKKGALPGHHKHLDHIIWQAVGQRLDIEPDFAEITDIQPGDVFLLASDGLTEVWSDIELADLSVYKPAELAPHLLNRCREIARDNYSFTLVEALPSLA